MPDISELNGTAITNVAEFGGLSVISTPSETFLLDTTYGSGAAAAYSLRRLATATTVLLRVRRDTGGGTGDDDEADVAYDSNNVLSLDSAISNASSGVTATTLGQFINVGTVGGTTYTNPDSLSGTASCFVDHWKDQSGNGNDAEQNTPGSQPQIHDGTVDTDLITENGKPALKFANDDLAFLGTDAPLTSLFFVYRGAATRNYFLYEDANQRMRWESNGAYLVKSGDYDFASGFVQDDTQKLNVILRTGSSSATGYQDGTSVATWAGLTSSNWDFNKFGATPSAVVYLQELFVWESNQSSNRPDIEENINSEYLIYQPTDQPTSGLLYDYGSQSGGTDAAVAYSVRQLSDKAVIALRVRRDSDDEEQNIGFDSNGDLDTAAISAFCGTANGYVTRWWDQSTNGNHADQPAGGTGSNGSQAQIYNGTTVITANNKPAVQFDGSDDFYPLSLSGLNTNNLSVVTVCQSDVTSGNKMQFTLNKGNNERYWNYLFQGNDTMWYGTATPISHGAIDTNQRLRTFIAGSTSTVARSFLNGTEASTTHALVNATLTANEQILGNYHTGSFYWDGTMQEFIVWGADQFNNRTGIETNIDNYFQIPGM